MPSTVPQSLSSMLGIAIRTAQRMGIHNESTLSKCTAFEAEMCRRLWWALVIFDSRVGELAGYSTATLGPQWDCNVPLNVNDSDLRAEMKQPPEAQGKNTEATFVVVRSELADFVRRVTVLPNYTKPVQGPVAKDAQPHASRETIAILEKAMESKHLKFCDVNNPIHFMTIWMTRALLARYHLMYHLSKHTKSPVDPTESQYVTRLSYCLDMLKCDTTIVTSPLTNGLRWVADHYFPFFAYIIIARDLMKRPLLREADHAWEVMSDHYEARFGSQWEGHHSFLTLFSKIVLQAWKPRELAFKQLGETPKPPRLVSAISRQMAGIREKETEPGTKQSNDMIGMSIDGLSMPMPIPMPAALDDYSWMCTAGEDGSYRLSGLDMYLDMSGQAIYIGANNFDLSAMDWNALPGDGADSSGPSLSYRV
jgi:hypothetical protein